MSANPPRAEGVRFRVERVGSVLGEGLVASGVVEAGEVRPPTSLRVLPGPSSTTTPRLVEVVKVVFDRKSQPSAGPGVTAGLTLRGVPGSPKVLSRIGRNWDLQEGDRLVSP